jgi:nickel-type superoxide dismutase maturation protease
MPTQRGRHRPLSFVLGACLIALALAALARRWLDVVEVRGGSMRPTLVPGDRLLVERWTYGRRAPRAGELVVAADPRQRTRELVKRVAAADAGLLELTGDAPAESTDSRAFGPIPSSAVRWRVVGRYWPLPRSVSRSHTSRPRPRRTPEPEQGGS